MKIIALIMMLIASPVQAGWFGPDNYDDCILDNVKPDMTKYAVIAVRNACRGKFPNKQVAKKKVEKNSQ